MTVLDLTPAMLIRSGTKVITSREESRRQRESNSNRRIAEVKRCRAVFQ